MSHTEQCFPRGAVPFWTSFGQTPMPASGWGRGVQRGLRGLEEPQGQAGCPAAAAETAMKPRRVFWGAGQKCKQEAAHNLPSPCAGQRARLRPRAKRRGRFSLENGGFRLRRGPDKCLFSESQEGPRASSPDLKVSTAQGGPLWGRKAPDPGQTPLPPSPHLPPPPPTSPTFPASGREL